MKHILAIAYCFILCGHLYGHGFGPDTLVTLLSRYKTAMCGQIVKKRTEAAQRIEQIYKSSINRHTKVKSYSEQSHLAAYLRVKAVGTSCVNCYISIEFNNDSSNVIECSPLQAFYLLGRQEWVPAYRLESGDILFSGNPSGARVSSASVVEKPLRVYTLETKKFHTFLVGKDKILAHNMSLAPSVLLSLGFAFGQGAVAGGSAGSALGPLVMGAGLALGGVIGVITACTSPSRKRVEYHVDFDINQLALARNGNTKKPKKTTTSTGGSGNSEKNPDEDPNKRNKKELIHTTNRQDKEDAEKLGYKLDRSPPFYTHGEPAFKKGSRWISPDNTQHNGGRWKMFDRSGDRIGTFDKNLNFLKD